MTDLDEFTMNPRASRRDEVWATTSAASDSVEAISRMARQVISPIPPRRRAATGLNNLVKIRGAEESPKARQVNSYTISFQRN
jgi:hypothetical protein